MNKIIWTIGFAISICSVSSQSVSVDDFSSINGPWNGELTYTDYQDDQSKFSIPCRMEAKRKRNKICLLLTFTEPDGRQITDKTTVKFKEEGTTLMIDKQTYRVAQVMGADEGKELQITLMGEGKDNNKPSKFKNMIVFSDSNFSMKKLVKYNGTEKYFERNSYVFRRAK